MTNKKGFTLVELLIVIGILAILATATVLVLNPAQLLAEARDSQRFNDLANIKSALALLQNTVPGADIAVGAGFTCGTNFGASVAGATERFTGAPTLANAGVRAVNGTGWVPADFTTIPGGQSPIGTLPIDPTNSTTLNYQYGCDTNGNFELNADLESTKYSNGGSGDKESDSKDGGDTGTIYETGTKMSI